MPLLWRERGREGKRLEREKRFSLSNSFFHFFFFFLLVFMFVVAVCFFCLQTKMRVGNAKCAARPFPPDVQTSFPTLFFQLNKRIRVCLVKIYKIRISIGSTIFILGPFTPGSSMIENLKQNLLHEIFGYYSNGAYAA